MGTIGLAEDATHKFCQEEDDTAALVLWHCNSLDNLRFLQIGAKMFMANSYTKEPLSKFWSLIKKMKLDDGTLTEDGLYNILTSVAVKEVLRQLIEI